MPVSDIKTLLDAYGGQYLILDYNHLFVSGSLREEVWLLRGADEPVVVAEILESARSFGIHDASAEKDFDSYSGGQQAILSCLLVMAVVRTAGLRGVRLLLSNVMDSISGNNRRRLRMLFAEMAASHGLRIFNAGDHGLRELGLP